VNTIPIAIGTALNVVFVYNMPASVYIPHSGEAGFQQDVAGKFFYNLISSVSDFLM
jgi:hypothetical protein